MIYYAVLFVSFFLLAWLIRMYKFVFHDLAIDSVALVNEMLADIDEDEKIRLIQKNTNKLVISLGKVMLLFLLAFALGAIPLIVYCFASQTDFNTLDLTSLWSILTISTGATIPFLLPARKKKSSAYSGLSQLLHRMALNNYHIADKLFKRETKKIKKKKLERREDFVIVSGLARAGTTSLMNNLARIDMFVSLGYNNMPFLMSPNTWAKFYKPKSNKLKERSHKDGIMIGLNSNEALEEYFFKVKASDSYIQEDILKEYELSRESYEEYLDYQSIIKLDDQKLYLAKNNNFLLRYKSVREHNDKFVMVILYRDPLSHAASLLEKHRDYSRLQKEDPFVLEYMNWLGHHEFGSNQKTFEFQNSISKKYTDEESLDYWLEAWINYYSYVLTHDHPKTLLVSYDSYCKDPKETLTTILSKIGIEAEIPEFESFVNRRKTEESCSEELLKRAMEVYEELLRRK